MQTPFIGPSYNLESRPASVQRTINMVPVPLEPGNERAPWVLKDVPGLTRVVQTEVCVSSDPFYANVVLLLRGQGTNGGVVITDNSTTAWVPDLNNGAVTASDQFISCFGATSIKFDSLDDVRYSSLAAQTAIGGSPGSVWTMEAWIRQTTTAQMGIFSYRPPVVIGWAFTSGGFRASIGGVWSDTYMSVSAPAAGVWSHRAMCRSGSLWTYWIDGVLAQSFTNALMIDFNVAEVRVGTSSTLNTDQPFEGHMYLRYTVGTCRYTVPFIPPNNFPATA